MHDALSTQCKRVRIVHSKMIIEHGNIVNDSFSFHPADSALFPFFQFSKLRTSRNHRSWAESILSLTPLCGLVVGNRESGVFNVEK